MEDSGIVDRLPGKLREGLPNDKCPVHLLTEAVLLAVCRVPNVIGSEKEGVDEDIVPDGPAVF